MRDLFHVGSRKFIILIAHINTTLYALCFWIQIGTLPYLTKKFDVDPITFGWLQTTFAVVQLLGGPLFGRFGDLFGSRSALMLAYTSAFASYFLLGSAGSLTAIFVSRFPSVFMHSMHGAQMVITDLSDADSRSSQLGKLGLSYGVGMVIGPVVGGLCTKYSNEQTAAFVAATGSLLSVFLVFMFIPNNTKSFRIKTRSSKEHDSDSDDETSEETAATSDESKSLFNIAEIIRIGSSNPLARKLLLIKTISGIPVGVLHSMFSVLALDHFHLTAEENGYVLSYVGVMSILSQGLLVGRLTSMGYDEFTLIKWSILLLTTSYGLILFIAFEIYSFCLALLPMVISGAIFSTVISGMLTKSVAPNETGTMLGISMAVHSLIRSIAPTIGGYLMQYYGLPAFGIMGVLFNAPLFAYLTVYN